MASTTKWRDTISENIDESIQKLIDEVVDDDKVTNVRWSNWRVEKFFEDTQSIILNGKEVKFNYIKYAYDHTDISNTSRSIRKEGFIIVYSSGFDVNYIIDQNSYAMKLLRKLLSYGGRNELERYVPDFSNDFFIWLIYRVYHSNGNIVVTTGGRKNFQLDAIKGIKGDTLDVQTQVIASGEAVMNIISTLSFLLESKNLNQIKLDLKYTDHSNISLGLQKGTVNAIMNEYSGIYEQLSLEEKNAKLYLLIYLEILPALFQEYYTDIGNDEWNKEVYKIFLKSVGETLREKIDNRISLLDEEDN